MRRDYVERGDVQTEFSCLGELANAGAEREEVFACDGGGEVGEREGNVVDTRFVKAEDVAVGG